MKELIKTTFNITGFLIHEKGQWFIEPYLEGHTLVIGPADSYKIPAELVENMNLNSLLKAKTVIEISESFFKK